VAAASASALACASLFEEVLQDTSRLSGQKWIVKLLDGREDRFHNELGMHKQVSLKLLESLPKDAGLSDTRRVSAEEQLAIFLHFARRGLSNEDLQERFELGPGTITKSVLRSLLGLISPAD